MTHRIKCGTNIHFIISSYITQCRHFSVNLFIRYKLTWLSDKLPVSLASLSLSELDAISTPRNHYQICSNLQRYVFSMFLFKTHTWWYFKYKLWTSVFVTAAGDIIDTETSGIAKKMYDVTLSIDTLSCVFFHSFGAEQEHWACSVYYTMLCYDVLYLSNWIDCQTVRWLVKSAVYCY